MTADDDRPGRGLRICHLGKFYPPATGGMETHVQTLARAQAALGAKVHVVVVNHRDAGGNDVTWKVAAHTHTKEENDGAVRVTRIGRRLSFSRFEVCPSLPLLLRRVVRDGVDVVHLHGPNPTMFAAATISLLERDGPTWFVTHHGDVVGKNAALGAAYTALERHVHGRAKFVFATSDAYAKGSPSLVPFEPNVRILPLGIELTPFESPSAGASAFAARLRREHGETLWLGVGRLIFYKGFTVALRALAAGVPGKLLIVGRGPLAEPLRREAERLGVGERVVWFDYLSDEELAGAYHAATAFWFPSVAKSEAFGLAQVEAMASGCAVINTSLADSGVPWVCPDGEGAITVPPDDVDAFAAAALRLLAHPDEREALGARGHARARREFDHIVMARRSFAFYRGSATD